MNTAWDTPLVESGPAGSRLTPDAERLIAAYQQAEARHAAFMLKLAQSLPEPGA
jgi:molybdate transport system regulatory protein